MAWSDIRERGQGSRVWLTVILFAVGSATAFVSAGFRIGGAMPVGPFIQIGGVVFAAGLCLRLGSGSFGTDRTRRWSSVVGIGMTALMQSLIVSISAMLLTYAAATAGRPLVDAELLAIDQLLGYKWMDYAQLVASHAELTSALIFAYSLLGPETLLVIVILAATARIRRLETYILAYILSLLITVGLFSLFPATTAWTHLGIPDAEIAAYRVLPLSGADWVRELLELRAGGMRVFDEIRGSGLTAFPSYHCVAALLFVWAAWPIRRVRIPMLAINACVIASAPIIGGHYVVDLIGGLVVTIVSVLIAERLYGWRFRGWLGPIGHVAPAGGAPLPAAGAN